MEQAITGTAIWQVNPAELSLTIARVAHDIRKGPEVAVGTFGGEVAAIDPSDDGKGKFRIQVREAGEHSWPSDRYLRQGVRANGWVMLQRVALGYELWRQLNGFPPVVAEDEPDQLKGDKKKVPLPK